MAPLITFVSSLNYSYFELCGKNFIHSFLRFAPPNVPLLLYCDASLESRSLWSYTTYQEHERDRVECIDLGIVPGAIEYVAEASSRDPNYIPDATKRLQKIGYKYRSDALTFGKKGLSLTDALMSPFEKGQYVFWFDADTVFKKEITEQFLLSLFTEDSGIVYFGRVRPHSECGFMGFNRMSTGFPTFLRHYSSCWLNNKIFTLPGQTDCDAFDYALAKAKEAGLKARSLSTVPEGPVIDKSILGPYLEHKKGTRKLTA